jgi:maleylpyruvate isomerase
MDEARDTGDGDWDPGDLTGLEASAIALNRTVDALSPGDLTEPSLLPEWSRAHVVAHLALNGYAMAGVVDGVGRGETIAMYESDEQRATDIDELVQGDDADLRDRLLAATTAFNDAVAALDGDHWDGVFTRTPGGPAWPAATIVATRRRELEIHHADLGAAYTHQDWSDDFVAELLDAVTVDQSGAGPFRVRATDLGRDWSVGGDGGPVVMGRGADLGWWLTGRGHGEGLSCESGSLPALGPWHRASATAIG